MKRTVLYISYNGLLEPILSSQVIPYLRNLSRDGFRFVLLTFEKRKDVKKAGFPTIDEIKKKLEQSRAGDPAAVDEKQIDDLVRSLQEEEKRLETAHRKLAKAKVKAEGAEREAKALGVGPIEENDDDE